MENKSKVCGTLMGVIIGDAMGMPVEMMSRQDILAMGGVNGFIDGIQHKISDTQGLAASTPTDDWQLTKAVADSLIRRNGFDIIDQAMIHVEALESSNFGWGGSTKIGIEEIKTYLDTRGKEGRSPTTPVNFAKHAPKVLGLGNGVAMKVAPLALSVAKTGYKTNDRRCLYRNGNYGGILYKQVKELGQMTHTHPSAFSGAAVIGTIILDNLLIGKTVCDDVDINELLEIFRDLCYFDGGGADSIYEQKLKVFKDKRLLFGPFDKVLEVTGNGSKAMESCALATAIYFRHFNDFRAGVLEAVNAGGDTDTIGSMVGAMIGSHVGLEGIPEEWRNFSSKFAEAIAVGEKLNGK